MCSLRKTTTHNDADCFKQGMRRPKTGSAHVADATSEQSIPSSTSVLNADATLLSGSFSPYSHAVDQPVLLDFGGNTVTLLVDSGATEHYLGTKLISGVYTTTVMFDFNA